MCEIQRHFVFFGMQSISVQPNQSPHSPRRPLFGLHNRSIIEKFFFLFSHPLAQSARKCERRRTRRWWIRFGCVSKPNKAIEMETSMEDKHLHCTVFRGPDYRCHAILREFIFLFCHIIDSAESFSSSKLICQKKINEIGRDVQLSVGRCPCVRCAIDTFPGFLSFWEGGKWKRPQT